MKFLSSRCIFISVLLLNIQEFSFGQDIFKSIRKIFKPQSVEKKMKYSKPARHSKLYSCCNLPSGERGICLPIDECHEALNQIYSGLRKYSDSECGWLNSRIPLECCSQVPDDVMDICRPRYNFKGDCGTPQYNFDGSLFNIYRMNLTAEMLKRKGFTVVAKAVDVDKLLSYYAFNKTHKINPPDSSILQGVGGADARREVTAYTALLGSKKKWSCTGVIINRNWILTAAHCFKKERISVVRLGEYDFSDNVITPFESPIDFGVKQVVIYPKYRSPSCYHDLALLRLDRAILYHRPDMRPVCLPWEREADKDLVGKIVTLTGWGATKYKGKLSPRIQEVNVTVLKTSICDRSFSRLRDFKDRFPKGISPDFVLCAGELNGGKDACMGDSGGPIVYQDKTGKFTLAGIVSSGYGCGNKAYQGIYMPINKPVYLTWIKRVAFAKYY